MVMPMMRRRVVWTLGETIETLVPTRRLRSVDLPTLGAPRSATKPARRGSPVTGSAGSATIPLLHPLEQPAGRLPLGRTLARSLAEAGLVAREARLDPELERVRRPLG